jgi:hypothetical protein
MRKGAFGDEESHLWGRERLPLGMRKVTVADAKVTFVDAKSHLC